MKRLGIALVAMGLLVGLLVPFSHGTALSLTLDIKQVWYVNKSPFVLDGKTQAGSQVWIEGQNLYTLADNDGLFKIFLDANEGGNFYQIVSQKDGLTATRDVYVERDSTPPVVTVITQSQAFEDFKINLSTKDANYLDMLCFSDPNCTVSIGGVRQEYEGNRAKLRIKLNKAPSANHQSLVVKDKFGNETEVILEIKNIHTKRIRIGVDSGDMAIDDRKLSINKLIIKNGTIMINIRLFSEATDARLSWDHNARITTIDAKGNVLLCKAGEKIVNFNGSICNVDEAPFIESGTTHVPIKSFFELFGFAYSFDGLGYVTLTKDIQP